MNLRVLCLPCHDGKSTSNLTDAEWRAKGRPRIGAESAGFLTVAAGAIGSPAWTGTVRGTRCVHTLPSHISKMVPSTIHIGPPGKTRTGNVVNGRVRQPDTWSTSRESSAAFLLKPSILW